MDIKKNKKMKKELYEYCKRNEFNPTSIRKGYEYFHNEYNISMMEYGHLVSAICRLKEKYIDYKDNASTKVRLNRGLDTIIRLVHDHMGLNGDGYKELYEKYDLFREIYPNLKYSTFTRAVRRALFESADVPNNMLSDDDLKRIKDIIKDYFNSQVDEEVEKVTNYFKSQVNNNIGGFKFEKNQARKNFKRMVVLSDFHCGHVLGLTPPKWQYNVDSAEFTEIAESQINAWDWYKNEIKMIGKDVDILVVNGDMIDGRGERSGGTELITTDRLKQAQMAYECLNQWNSDQVFMTRGTPYHTGQGEQFEDVVAERMGAHIDNTINIKVNGKIFNFRHKVGNSSVPYGKSTQVIKEAIWNLIQSVHYKTDSADVVIRSHVHYMTINQDSMRFSITTPALQLNSRYGEQQCSGLTDFGFIVFDIYENGDIIVDPHVAKIHEEESKSTIIEI